MNGAARGTRFAAVEISSAMSYLHTNSIVHGDLNPNNILLASSTKDIRRCVAKVGNVAAAVPPLYPRARASLPG
jgi:serine/threonine protein kinase